MALLVRWPTRPPKVSQSLGPAESARADGERGNWEVSKVEQMIGELRVGFADHLAMFEQLRVEFPDHQP